MKMTRHKKQHLKRPQQRLKDSNKRVGLTLTVRHLFSPLVAPGQ
jgi:hypothetical protein